MSLINRISRSHPFCPISSNSRTSSLISPAKPPSNRSSEPLMEVMGVRSSWAAMERNSLLAWSIFFSRVTSQ